MQHLPLALFAAVSLLLLAACGGDSSSRALVDAAASGTPGGAGAAAPGTPAPAASSTPEPTQAGPPGLRTTISGTSRILGDKAEIRVEYAVTAFGSTQLARVRLLQDGVEVDDSGPLQQRQYRRIVTFKVEPGERHTYRVTTEAPGAAAGNVQSTVQCATSASPTPGPRAAGRQ